MNNSRIVCPYCGARCDGGSDREVECGLCGKWLEVSGKAKSPADKPKALFKTKLLEKSDKQSVSAAEYRPRAILVLRCWLFGAAGNHLRWLGLEEKHPFLNWERLRSLWLGVLSMRMGDALMALGSFLVTGCIWFVELFAVIFGKYRTDAFGRPVRWIKPK